MFNFLAGLGFIIFATFSIINGSFGWDKGGSVSRKESPKSFWIFISLFMLIGILWSFFGLLAILNG